MTDPYLLKLDPCRQDLAGLILGAVEKALGQCELALTDLFNYFEKPPEPTMGDYALPCFRFAKVLRRKPQNIAAYFKQEIEQANSPWIERVEVINAFLNIFVHKAELFKRVASEIFSGEYFEVLGGHPDNQKIKVMIEYSQPNTHKEFHVGHMRNVALGDSLVRLYRYCGFPVIAANYPGDEGTHIAKCLWHIKRSELHPPSENKGEWLGQQYVAAQKALAQADPETKKIYDKEVSAVLQEVESKQGPMYELWRKTRQWSLESFYEIYRWLDVHFDHYFFESDVSEESQQIVDEYYEKGVFVEDDGAIGIDLNKFKLGFFLLRKRDGNTLYSAKDLALARRKFEEFGVDRSIYVVGQEQRLHFQQVFKTLELMGFDKASNCFHLSHGLVMVPEGKMASRAGTAIPFSRLKTRLEQELDGPLAKYKSEWSADEYQETKRRLAVGAIKYGMLNTEPIRDVVFDLKDWLSFEGNTGPYLMYSYARTQSILRRAKSEGIEPSPSARLELLKDETEYELIRYVYDFNERVFQTMAQYKPSTMTHYLFELCKVFNRFYAKVPVMKADSPELRQARINLIFSFVQVLYHGLRLLGITPPERM